MARNQILTIVVYGFLHFQAVADVGTARVQHVHEDHRLRSLHAGHDFHHFARLNVEDDLLVGAPHVRRNDANALGRDVHPLGGHKLVRADKDAGGHQRGVHMLDGVLVVGDVLAYKVCDCQLVGGVDVVVLVFRVRMYWLVCWPETATYAISKQAGATAIIPLCRWHLTRIHVANLPNDIVDFDRQVFYAVLRVRRNEKGGLVSERRNRRTHTAPHT